MILSHIWKTLKKKLMQNWSNLIIMKYGNTWCQYMMWVKSYLISNIIMESFKTMFIWVFKTCLWVLKLFTFPECFFIKALCKFLKEIYKALKYKLSLLHILYVLVCTEIFTTSVCLEKYFLLHRIICFKQNMTYFPNHYKKLSFFWMLSQAQYI